MIPIPATHNLKWLTGFALAILLGSIAAYVYTDNYFFLPLPFIFLYVVLVGVNWKTAYWIFLFTIPVSTELSLIQDSLAISLPDEPLMWSFLLLTIVIIARQPNILPKWWWKNPLVFIVVLQFLWLIVAVIYSKVPLFSVKFLAAKVWFLCSFFILPIFIFKEKRDFKKGFLIVLVPLLLTMVVIIIRHAMLNFSFAKIQAAVRYIYYNHVDYSTVISMFFPLVCVAYPLTKGRSKVTRGIVLFLILFFLPAIYLTYARAAIIALVFAAAIAVAIRIKMVNYIMPAIYGLIAIGLVFVIRHNKFIDYRPNFNKTYMHHNFEDHIIATFRGTDMSSMERLYRWVAAFRMSRDRPIVGYGPHAFYYYYKPYAVTSFTTYVSRNPEHSTTHNYFIFMLVEQGWPAMLLYALLVAAFFAQAQKVYHRFKDRFYKHCTMGIAMMFAAGFINNFFSELIETHKVGALFYLSIALLIILDRKSRQLEETDTAQPATDPAI